MAHILSSSTRAVLAIHKKEPESLSFFWCLVCIEAILCEADSLGITVVRMYDIAGHGKNEVDHVGGVTKTKIRREVAAGNSLQFANQMEEFLHGKFNQKTDLYVFTDITPERLAQERKIFFFNRQWIF